jgi:phospholipid/cholesterol/gamma-HCH transport system permease protein
MTDVSAAALADTPADDGPSLRPLGEAQGWLLVGDWTLLKLRTHFAELQERIAAAVQAPGAEWDLRQVQRMDTAGALTLWQGWGRRRPEHLQWLPEQEALFEQFLLAAAPPRRRRPPAFGLPALGATLLGFALHLRDAVALAGQLLIDVVTVLRHPALIGWREISANVYRTGAQALGITALVGFLVGVTLAYLSARQLQAYGADIFIVNILGLSVLRELGPLLAAVIVAGRSGSSMTAQLGVMRVTQELDALSVMGISHTVRLVLPKVIALALAMPLVVLWTSGVMLAGGMLAARAQLGLDPLQFLHGLPGAVAAANLWLGWSKALIFGALIALLACHFGLRIKPNTESLGEGVTQSVVTSITVVIIVDAVFAVLFSDVGL